MPEQTAKPLPVTFHFNRDVEKLPNGQEIGHSMFLIIVSDNALKGITEDSPLRYLHARFNGSATPGTRLRALADAVQDMEQRNQVEDRSAPPANLGEKIIAGIFGPPKKKNP